MLSASSTERSSVQNVTMLFSIVIFAMAMGTTDAIYCLSCTGVVSPRHCHTVQKCGNGKVCFTQRYSGINGEVLYDTGCHTSSICSKRTFLGLLRSHNPAYAHTEQCVECCSTDVCNHKGCGALDYPNRRGPLCFNCPQSVDPAVCSSVTVCDDNEVCHLHEEVEFGESYFVSSCSQRNICGSGSPSIFGKRSSDRCLVCCDSDLCNSKCGNKTTQTTQATTPSTTTTTTIPTTTLKYSAPFDCWEIFQNGNNGSGIYTIFPFGINGKNVSVHCNMDIAPGGWTVFQQRENLTVDFVRSWEDFKNGFGSNEEFWLGNEILHLLTSRYRNQLYIGISHTNGNYWYEKYPYIRVAPESDKYRLHVEGPATGTAGDEVLRSSTGGSLNNQQFSTYDNDNSPGKCATNNGGWWYNSCGWVELNNRQYLYYHNRIEYAKYSRSSIMMITRSQ